jgi:pimeloyl-ACP methyl ester carboxylesterase
MKVLSRLSCVLPALIFLPVCFGQGNGSGKAPVTAVAAVSSRTPVEKVPSQMLKVSTGAGTGLLPVYVTIKGRNADLGQVYPSVTRAVIIIHGNRRNAGAYDRVMDQAVYQSGPEYWNTILIAPEFLEQNDAAVNQVADEVLRWKHQGWVDGENAHDVEISSFDALDALLERLSNHILLPNLKSIVLVGYAAGGMVVQRYAVAGKGGDGVIHSGVRMRYVVANPSSYLYFSGERPTPVEFGEFGFAVPARECSGINRWRYGIDDPPPYVGTADFTAFEDRYIHRDVIYLLGSEAVELNDSGDTGCAGEEQGSTRFFRGEAYFRYLELRHPELKTGAATQQLWVVQGVGNDANKMLTSFCGKAALFDMGSCSTRELPPKP